jgi:ATP-dependent DNA helicase RecQ
VDEIAAYVSTGRCRHGHINAYLGGRSIERCSACDNCVPVPPLPDPGLPDERTQLVTVLRCVANAPWSWGRQTLVRILRGDSQARHGRGSLHEKACAQAEFGALGFRSETAIRRMVERLEDAGFLAPRQLKHGGVVLDLMAKGSAALEDSCALEGLVESEEVQEGEPSPERARTENEEEPEVDEALFERLRAWRLKQAREEDMPTFVVFHDSHLQAIAARRPTTLDALSEVKGVGPRKLEKYGVAIIGLVREHRQEHGD